MTRKGTRPGFKIRHDLNLRTGGWRKAHPFRRSWTAIVLLAVMDLIFIGPAVGVFAQAADGWSTFESLFDLVAALFLSAWLLGWITAPLLMSGILALMLFGREVIRPRGDKVQIFLGLPVGGLAAIYDVSRMRNLRVEVPGKPSSGE